MGQYIETFANFWFFVMFFHILDEEVQESVWKSGIASTRILIPNLQFFSLFSWIFVSFSADICLIFVTEIQDDV